MIQKSEIATLEISNHGLTIINESGLYALIFGKDVAEALGYGNTRKAIADHVDEEDKMDGVTIRDSIGREQTPVLINESGLYALKLTFKIIHFTDKVADGEHRDLTILKPPRNKGRMYSKYHKTAA